MQTDIITPLKNLRETAESRFSTLTGMRSDFVEGYLMAIGHALELAELIQLRIDLGLAQEKGQS